MTFLLKGRKSRCSDQHGGLTGQWHEVKDTILCFDFAAVAAEFILSVVEGLSMNGTFPLVLSVAQRSRRMSETLTSRHWTHRGEMLGIAPTGKEVTMTGQAIYRIARGKIEEAWSHGDALGMLQQFGVMPRQ